MLHHHSVIASALIAIAVVAAPVFADSHKRENEDRVLKAVGKAIERLERFDLPEVESHKAHPSALFIGPGGQVRIIFGEITANASSTLTVKSWNVSLVVDISKARLIAVGTSTPNFAVGDKVSVKGSMSTTSATVIASIAHDLTPSPDRRGKHTAWNADRRDAVSERIEKFLERLQSLRLRIMDD